MQTTETRPTSSRDAANVQVQTEAITPSAIKTIRLADGDHEVSRCELVQFAVGEAHSPIMPPRLFPTLKYLDRTSGKTFWTQLSNVLGFSVE